jgi:uncharacterized protein (DUF2345 family)
MNFASDLAANRIDGGRVQSEVTGHTQPLIRLIAPDSLSSATQAALSETAGSDTLALLLAAPEFQRR